MEDLKVYTCADVEKLLNVTRRTLYNYIHGGQIEAVKIGRQWCFTDEAIRDFLKRGTDKNYLNKI